MKALIIINPTAGRTNRRQTSESFIRTMRMHGYDCRTVITTAAGDAERTVQSCADDYDIVVCSGGDGTLNEVVNGLKTLEDPPAISYIPAGTTNDFANSMGLTGNLRENLGAVFSGKRQNVDAGAANGRRFIYSATFGAFVPSAYLTPQSMKNRLGKMAYFFECARELPSIKPYRMTITDDRHFTAHGEYAFGAVSNATSIGGFLHYGSDEVDFSDGLHEVLLIRYPQNLAQLSAIVRALVAGDYHADGIERFKSSSLRFICDEMPDWALDGERFTAEKELIFTNIPHAVNILVPDRIAAAS